VDLSLVIETKIQKDVFTSIQLIAEFITEKQQMFKRKNNKKILKK
jgi:hypothetical protein